MLELVVAAPPPLFFSWWPLEGPLPLAGSLRPACVRGRESEGGVAPIDPPAVGVDLRRRDAIGRVMGERAGRR